MKKTIHIEKDEEIEWAKVPASATPDSGSMTFECPAELALKTIGKALGTANVRMTVTWAVIDEMGECRE